MRTALQFVPFPPAPVNSGGRRRSLEMFRSLRALGLRTTLAFFEPPPTTGTAAACRAALGGLASAGGGLAGFRPRSLDYWLGTLMIRMDRLCGRRSCEDLLGYPLNAPTARSWFARVLDRTAPDVLLMTASNSAGLMGDRVPAGVRTVMDSHDLVTVLLRQVRALAARIPVAGALDLHRLDDDLLDEGFFVRLRPAADPAEYAVYDRFEHTLSISPVEADLIRANTSSTRVSYVPVTMPAIDARDRWEGPAVTVMSDYVANIQGLAFLVRRVLPAVLAAAPDFRLAVYGNLCARLSPTPGLDLAGFAPDLSAAYRRCGFAVSPVLGGTGQQVKVVEAMAHGLGVVAMRRGAAASPVRHGENGLLADTPAEFADHLVRLWRDPDLRRRLGTAARHTIAEECSPRRLTESLAAALARRPPQARRP